MKVIVMYITFSLCIVSNIAAQSFTKRHDKITKDNLEQFMADWECWSDSLWIVSAKENIDSVNELYNKIYFSYNDYDEETRLIQERIEEIRSGTDLDLLYSLRDTLGTVVNSAIDELITTYEKMTTEEKIGEIEATHSLRIKYFTIPHEVKISFYNDSVYAQILQHYEAQEGDEDFEKKYTPYKIVTIRPYLKYPDKKCLYFHHSDNTNDLLSDFLGGLYLRDKEDYSQINSENKTLLSKYIYVHYAHWGGGWDFLSDPMITEINYYLDGYSFSTCSWNSGESYFVPYCCPENKIIIMLYTYIE